MTHEVNIYHCQKCGKVVKRECGRPRPSCCGETMAIAVPHVRFDETRCEPRSAAEAADVRPGIGQ